MESNIVLFSRNPKGGECQEKDHGALPASCDFPAEHRVHIRTTNPIASIFASMRVRTAKTRGRLSRPTGFTMLFKLTISAQRTRRKLNGSNWLPNLSEGIGFEEGIRTVKIAA